MSGERRCEPRLPQSIDIRTVLLSSETLDPGSWTRAGLSRCRPDGIKRLACTKYYRRRASSGWPPVGLSPKYWRRSFPGARRAGRNVLRDLSGIPGPAPPAAPPPPRRPPPPRPASPGSAGGWAPRPSADGSPAGPEGGGRGPRGGMPVHISAAFDSGNVEVGACTRRRGIAVGRREGGGAEPGAAQVVDASDPNNIRLKIRPDPFCRGDNITHFQCGLVANLLRAQEEA